MNPRGNPGTFSYIILRNTPASEAKTGQRPKLKHLFKVSRLRINSEKGDFLESPVRGEEEHTYTGPMGPSHTRLQFSRKGSVKDMQREIHS